MVDLDHLDLAALDPEGMLSIVEASPAQWEHARELAHAAPPPRLTAPVRSVVVAGMGGSGIVGDLVTLLADRTGAAPVVAVKGYTLPAWVGPESLVVTVSHSGSTEETWSCLEQAAARDASLFVVTSGGEIGAWATEHDVSTAAVPGGYQPRASLPYLSAPVIVALARAGVLAGGIIDELAAVPGHLAPLVEVWGHRATGDNEAKEVARGLADLVPVFVGGRGAGALVALRARCQINENAERPAIDSQLPELDHNAVVGWARGVPGGAGVSPFGLLQIMSPHDDHARTIRRFEVTAEVAAPGFARVLTHRLQGDGLLGRVAAGILFVDLVSVYVALLSGVDPTPVHAIDELKQRLGAADASG